MKYPWKKKSFFRRFLISYAIVLIVPFLTILLTYVTSERAVRQGTLNSSANSLHQFFNVVDSRLSEMESTAFQALGNIHVKARGREATLAGAQSAYRVYETRQELTKLHRDILADLFIYYHRTDFVISAINSCLSTEEFFSVYLQDTFEGNGMDFRTLISPNKSNTPRLISLGGELTTPRLAMVLSQNTDYILGKPNATAVVSMSPAVLREMLQSADFQQDGTLLIVNEAGRVLASSRQVPQELDFSSVQSKNLVQQTIGGEQYIVQFFKSNIVNCNYVSLTPVSSFWSQLNALRAICLISLGCCMLISAGIAVILARRSFYPITSLLATIRTKTSQTFDSRQVDELSFVGEVLEQALEENHLLSKRIERESSALRDDFLLRALQGVMIPEPEGEDDAFTGHHIRLLSDQFSVMHIRVESFDEKLVGRKGTWDGQRNLSFIMSQVFAEICQQEHQGFLIDLGPDDFAGIINFSQDAADCLAAARGICEQLRQFIHANFGICATIALSEVQSGLSGIHLGHWQAEQAMKYRFAKGREAQLFYADIAAKRFLYNSQADGKAAQILMHYIAQDQPEPLEGYIDQVWDYARVDQHSSIDTIRCFQYDMVNVLGKILHEIDAIPGEQEMKLIHRLLEADTLSEFRILLGEAVEEFRQRRLCRRKSDTVCDRAEIYIREHYGDINLNLNALGEALGLSPSYLSKLFKAQKGISPLDYLYQVRIELAKRLLRNSDQTMDEIAEQTGFLNGIALNKIFKKMEGITPGAYRKLIGRGR